MTRNSTVRKRQGRGNEARGCARLLMVGAHTGSQAKRVERCTIVHNFGWPAHDEDSSDPDVSTITVHTRIQTY